MNFQNQDLLYFITFSVVIFSLLITVFYLWHNFKAGFAEKLTGLIFIFICYFYWVEFLIHLGLIIRLPHFFRTGILVSLILIPLIYLTLLKILSGKGFRWVECFHAVPSLLFLVNFLPFYLKSSAFKQAHLMQLTSLETIYDVNEGWFLSGNFIFMMRILQLLFYLTGMLFLLKKYADVLISSKKKKKLAIAFTTFLSLNFLVTILYALKLFGENNEEYALIAYMLITFFFFLFFMMNPEILFNYNFLFKHIEIYGDTHKNQANKSIQNDNESIIKHFPTVDFDEFHISKKEKIRLAKIEQYLEEFKPYLKEDFSLLELEQSIQVSSKLISKSIKLKYQLNFKQYTNNLRINYAIQKLKSDANWSNYSNKAIAGNIGFSSPNSFYASFKEYTGITPGNYIQKMKAESFSNIK